MKNRPKQVCVIVNLMFRVHQ